MITPETKKQLLTFQKNEITEHFIYKKLAQSDKKNSKVLEHIAEDELKHYNIYKKYTKEEVSPSKLKIWKYWLISKIAGLTFAIKLMESGEQNAQEDYKGVNIPEIKSIMQDEHKHEKELISMINEEKLNYIGSMVLGLNDALVEITGTIAGLTFAFSNTRLVAMAAGITGIAATLSMAASEYLSKKSESKENPLKSAVYTGIAYIFAIFFLVLPYFLFTNKYLALGTTLASVVIIIFVFTFFTSVVKERSFTRSFLEMAILSLSVAGISFLIGLGMKYFLGVDA